MESVNIRRVSLSEISELQEIGRSTFIETFADVNEEAPMRQYVSESFSLDKLGAELKNAESRIYFALIGERIIGYLKLNVGSAQTEPQDLDALEIERIYVLKEFHGQQVGHLLYQHALSVAEQLKASYVWLGVWEENHRALRFYEKNGFVRFGTHEFKLGNELQTDLMMKKMVTVGGDVIA